MRQAEALLAAAALPTVFPLLRPDCKKFDVWAERVLARGISPDDPPPRLLEGGVAALSRGERERIVRWPGENAPRAWAELRGLLLEERLAEALVAGAVMAGLNERRGIDPLALDALEYGEEAVEDPGALAVAIEPSDLWSPAEAEVAGAALDAVPEDELDDERWDAVVASEAELLATGRHRSRLVRLVGYVRRALPDPDYPRASVALAGACDAFQRDRAVRRRLAALLLTDAL